MKDKGEKLKACPYCGEEAKAHCCISTDGPQHWVVRCTHCIAEFPPRFSIVLFTEKEAIEAWNRRTSTEDAGGEEKIYRVARELVEQLDMSNWVEQDTGMGHTVKNLKALLELKVILKGADDGTIK